MLGGSHHVDPSRKQGAARQRRGGATQETMDGRRNRVRQLLEEARVRPASVFARCCPKNTVNTAVLGFRGAKNSDIYFTAFFAKSSSKNVKTQPI